MLMNRKSSGLSPTYMVVYGFFNLIKSMLSAICRSAIAFLNAIVDEILCVISYYQMWVDTHCGVVVGEFRVRV